MARVAALEILVVSKDDKLPVATVYFRSMSATSVERELEVAELRQSDVEALEASVVVHNMHK